MQDYLEHKSHKYTKKWYQNGQWHYYYGYDKKKSNPIERVADWLGFDERQTYKTAKNRYESDRKLQDHVSRSAAAEYSKGHRDTSGLYAKRWYESEKQNLRYSQFYYQQALKQYQKTPLYKMEKAVEKGKKALKKVVNKLKKKK